MLQAYARYVGSGRSIGSLPPVGFAKDDQNALSSNFDRLSKGNPCEDIRFEVLATSRAGLCPYCRLSEATTIDHILEKVDFPEFSILRENLAPCCPNCNGRKEATRRQNPRGLHLYYQGFPTVPFLDVRIAVGSVAVNYDFSISTSSTPDRVWLQEVEVHFRRMNLATRFGNGAISVMSDLGLPLRIAHDLGGKGDVRSCLNRFADGVARHWTEGDWKTALLRHAANSEEFCDRGVFLLP